MELVTYGMITLLISASSISKLLTFAFRFAMLLTYAFRFSTLVDISANVYINRCFRSHLTMDDEE